MNKLIPDGSWSFSDRVSSLVEVHSGGIDRGWLLKTAAAGVFKDVALKPEKGHSYIHLIALGDAERYGENKNGDLFYKSAQTFHFPAPAGESSYALRKGTVDTHHTFKTHSKVYRHHIHGPGAKAYGTVVKTAHNDDASRVELLIRVPNDEWETQLHKLASGGTVPFSMACSVPYDVCNVCGNRASTRKDYCDHAKNHLTAITKEGYAIGVINETPTFFDISEVTSNADRIALGLLKAAGDRDRTRGVISGAELAELAGTISPSSLLDAKRASAIEKLSAIEKEIEGMAINPVEACEVSGAGSLSDEEIAKLKSDSSALALMGTLADAQITLSVRDFVRLLTDDSRVHRAVPEAESLVPGIFGKLLSGGSCLRSPFEFDDDLLPGRVMRNIADMIPGHSLAGGAPGKRVRVTIIRGMPKTAAVRTAQEDAGPVAKAVAEAYAWYKAAAAERGARNLPDSEKDLFLRRAVLQNYLR